ncbi:uncharacterized protein FA14DRAFT_160091 [Meira miltonrushii]|uniref:Uncharacterized protein n=1 Tax=Meira miltonrushii TaxID=1280837 RepID=A0A316VAP4_9BASI|nr:uncharacterized protein FA14DRAFT_160091 [Meira miltonrushii]PWN34520.1 hypothetical protein FA14DRAFT_160091 [Meira miltonrushii]
MSSIQQQPSSKSWIEPWSKAVSQAAEDQKKSHRRRNSFMVQSKINHSRTPSETIIKPAATSNVFENAGRLPSPPILQRIFFSPHPDDIAYSAYGTASKKPRCCHHDEENEDAHSYASTSSFKKQSHLRVQREDSGVALPSPSLSSSSKFSDDATLVATPSYASSASSTSSGSRRNSAVDLKTNTQNALIVTVFSKSRCANGEIGARLNRNVEDTTSLRTDEDEAFARSIGCDLLQLGFPDSSARDEPSRRPDLAEAAMKGPAGTKIRDVDHYIFEDVRKSLEPLVWMAVRAGAKIHLPLGVGCHVDHWMVRVAVLSILDELDVKLGETTKMLSEPLKEIFSTHLVGGKEPLHERLVFYEDLPYADAQTNSHVESLAKAVLPCGAKAQLVHLTESDWCKKRAAILAYASQMKPTILPSLYNHATRLAHLGKTIDPDFDSSKPHLVAERIWIIDATLRRLALEQQQ